MTEQTFLMLASIAPSPLYGYGIIKAVKELSSGRIVLRAGTLYAAVDRLVREGLLAVGREEVVDSRLRRYYEITELGLEALRIETKRLESNAKVAHRQLRRRSELGLA
jgi:PadR family transcriptional regulator, regulatory protein PadR